MLGDKIPSLTSQRARAAIREVLGVETHEDLPLFVLFYALGWEDEKCTPSGEMLPMHLFKSENEKRFYNAGSRDYALALAELKGANNRYGTTGRRLLTSADSDYD